MAGNIFQIWKIENFSCWNRDVHGRCIASPLLLFSSCKYMELYPKSVSGNDEHLVVRFCDVQKQFSGGELSFISSNGSVICTLPVKRGNINNVLVSPLGPKYDDIISQIRKQEAKHEDQLTLQFIPSGGKIYEQRMCTNIDVLKIPLEIDKNLIQSVKLKELKNVLLIYPKEGDAIYFKISRKEEEMQLILEPLNINEKAVLVESCMRLLNKNNALIRCEVNKHVFRSKQPWTFSNSLKFKEFVDKGKSLNICFKIIIGDVKKRYNNLLYCSEGIKMGQNTHVCVPEEKSSKGLKSVSSKQTGDSMTRPTEEIIKNYSLSNLTENSVSMLTEELMCLYQDQAFSDLLLNCETVSFPVHKNILSARSPVFKRMLSNDMMEAASGTVDIEDLDPSILAHFLAFLYTGKVDDLPVESAPKLYYAADKYQVPTLKMTCTVFMSANVSISNVCDILSLADEHQDALLLSAARDFILNNLNEVSRSEEWRCFMKSQPLLAVETMTHFTAKDFVKKSDPR